MEFFKSFFQGLMVIAIYEVVGLALHWATKRYRERWWRAIGYPARDALMAGMKAAGMPTCARAASKRGKVVIVEVIGGSSTRFYKINMASPDRTAVDVNNAVEVERRGECGN